MHVCADRLCLQLTVALRLVIDNEYLKCHAGSDSKISFRGKVKTKVGKIFGYIRLYHSS
jgi:hypothetical protein